MDSSLLVIDCVIDALIFFLVRVTRTFTQFCSSGETGRRIGPGSAPPTFRFFFSVSSAFVCFEEKKAKVAR